MASAAYSSSYPSRRARPNAIVPDIEALLEAQKRNDSGLFSSPTSSFLDSDDTNDIDTPTSLRPPPRGPKKTKPRRLDRAVFSGVNSSGSAGLFVNSQHGSASSSLDSYIDTRPLKVPILRTQTRPPPIVIQKPSKPFPTVTNSPAVLPPPPSRSTKTLSFLGGSNTASPNQSQVALAPNISMSAATSPLDAASSIMDWSPPYTSPISPIDPSPPVDIQPPLSAIKVSLDPPPPPPKNPLRIASTPPKTPPKNIQSTQRVNNTRTQDSSVAPRPSSNLTKIVQALHLESLEKPHPPENPPPPPPRHQRLEKLAITDPAAAAASIMTHRPSMPSIYSGTGRDSFIDLDDAFSPLDYSHPQSVQSTVRNSIASEVTIQEPMTYNMYPTPTRMTYRVGDFERPSSASSDASLLPQFNHDAPYPPPTPRRPRPASMVLTPTAFITPDVVHVMKPAPPRAQKPPQLLRKAAAQLPPPSEKLPLEPPPTTNKRAPGERADILRKHRKIAQMLGENVSGMLWPSDDPHARNARHRKGARSAELKQGDGPEVVMDIGPGRRHSSPTSPGFGKEDEQDEYTAMVRALERGERTALGVNSSARGDSPVSFMELSDEEEARGEDRDHDSTPSTPTEERKVKRERLAKLHRFLGSRVPIELALGATYLPREADLPPLQPLQELSDWEVIHEERKEGRHLRRRSSSAALPGYVVPETDERAKNEQRDKERVLNVKRAQKMEQMFGTRPPATLYQTRTASASPARSRPSPSPPGNQVQVQNGVGNRSPRSKGRRKRSGSESHDALLGDDAVSKRASAVYMYYRHSINSLTDIVDKDDRASLAQLHQYLNESISEEGGTGAEPRSPSTRERRRSLPVRSSVQSFTSIATSPPPLPNPGGFQERRRRAAKLANFFGVNYRELFGDVVASIEMGVVDEVRVGSLQPHEVEELMVKLRSLKTRRNEITG